MKNSEVYDSLLFLDLNDVKEQYSEEEPCKILFLADDRHDARVVLDYIESFKKYSKNNVLIINPIYETPNNISLYEFDSIVIHYSIFILSEYFFSKEWSDYVTKFNGAKAQIIQDEFRQINEMKEKMASLGISIIFTSLNAENAEKVYGGNILSNVIIVTCLPGYISEYMYDIKTLPIDQRQTDIFYRGRILPANVGLSAYDKFHIGNMFSEIAEEFNLVVDIKSKEDERIYGYGWLKSLSNSRATLGVEAGATMFDFDGTIEKLLEEFVTKNYESDFFARWEHIKSYQDNVIHGTLPPKLLEAIATDTALILFKGNYAGILEPGKHYIELARDGSNIYKVIKKLRDIEYLQRIVKNARRDVLYQEKLSFKFLWSKFDSLINRDFKVNFQNQTSDNLSNKNSVFWDELCGSQLAKTLGIKDSSVESLKKFDDWYFDFYPYLFDHIPFKEMKGKRVLEIGLGYGTVSQRIAESGADGYYMDIAEGPVSMVSQRLLQNKLEGSSLKGNILQPAFKENSFDYIVAIGCLHHTGNLKSAIKKCYDLLKPGGELIFMVYYAYSYRRFRMSPGLSFKNILKELFGYRGVVGSGSDRQRAAYDSSSEGDGAPHTDWISVKSLRSFCKKYRSFEATIENIDQEVPFKNKTRKELLNTKWPSIVGLDLYAKAIK